MVELGLDGAGLESEPPNCDSNPAAKLSRADLRAAAEALRRSSVVLSAFVGTVLDRPSTRVLS